MGLIRACPRTVPLLARVSTLTVSLVESLDVLAPVPLSVVQPWVDAGWLQVADLRPTLPFRPPGLVKPADRATPRCHPDHGPTPRPADSGQLEDTHRNRLRPWPQGLQAADEAAAVQPRPGAGRCHDGDHRAGAARLHRLVDPHAVVHGEQGAVVHAHFVERVQCLHAIGSQQQPAEPSGHTLPCSASRPGPPQKRPPRMGTRQGSPPCETPAPRARRSRPRPARPGAGWAVRRRGRWRCVGGRPCRGSRVVDDVTRPGDWRAPHAQGLLGLGIAVGRSGHRRSHAIA